MQKCSVTVRTDLSEDRSNGLCGWVGGCRRCRLKVGSRAGEIQLVRAERGCLGASSSAPSARALQTSLLTVRIPSPSSTSRFRLPCRGRNRKSALHFILQTADLAGFWFAKICTSCLIKRLWKGVTASIGLRRHLSSLDPPREMHQTRPWRFQQGAVHQQEVVHHCFANDPNWARP